MLGNNRNSMLTMGVFYSDYKTAIILNLINDRFGLKGS